MKKWIMNSLTLPSEGLYRAIRLTEVEASDWLMKNGAQAISTVGYPATAAKIYGMSGVNVRLSRAKTEMAPGDEALVVRLRYRLQDPSDKGHYLPQDDDWEFFLLKREG